MFQRRYLQSTGLLLKSCRFKLTDVNKCYFHQRIKSLSAEERVAEYYLFNPTDESAVNITKVKFDTQLKVDSFFEDKLLDNCGVSKIADMMHTSGEIAKQNGKISFLKMHLPTIVVRLTALSDLEWSLMDISKIFRSLHYFSIQTKGFSDILEVMTIVMKNEITKGKIPTPENIAALILTLQKSEYEENVVGKVLMLATKLIKKCTRVIDGPEFCDILYGLQNMSNSHFRVSELLHALYLNSANNRNNIAPIHLSNALFGIQCMNEDNQNINDIILILTKKLEKTNEKFQLSEIVSMLYGVRSKNQKNHVVAGLLNSITTKMSNCEDNFTPSLISSAINGMRGMKVTSTEEDRKSVV